MAYRTDKFAVGDSVNWTDESRSKFAAEYGEGPLVITRIDEEEIFMWPMMGHTQIIHFEGSYPSGFSGYHFQKKKTGPSEEEIRAIALTEIARRLELAKLALLQVDSDYDLRKGFISSDTMRDVTRALELLK